MNDLSLMIIIANSSNEKKYVKVLEKYKAKFKYIAYGIGTASSSLLEYFGLNEIEKMVILAILPNIASKYALKDMHYKYKMYEPGNGIAFTIPLSSSTKYMNDIYDDKKRDDIKMENSNQHLIVTITNDGYAEMVMNAAKKVGATGGTTISGRGLETEKIIKFLGIAIQPEKDIILILAEDDKKTTIMNEIVATCGLKTPGAGICFSIPVDHVVGLKKELNIE